LRFLDFETERFVECFHAFPVGYAVVLPTTRAGAFDFSCFLAFSAAFPFDLSRLSGRKVEGEHSSPI
jgi:hypothetical protein